MCDMCDMSEDVFENDCLTLGLGYRERVVKTTVRLS